MAFINRQEVIRTLAKHMGMLDDSVKFKGEMTQHNINEHPVTIDLSQVPDDKLTLLHEIALLASRPQAPPVQALPVGQKGKVH